MLQKNDSGLFIVFEGGEGSGKTTQARLLSQWLIARGYDVLVTKQPGGDESVCKQIRSLVLDPQYFGQISPRTELLLFMADKAQHLDYVVRPALAEGKIVISDRYVASTYAYQVVARESCSREEFRTMLQYATQRFEPHMTVWLDVDPALGMTRNSAVPSQHLRFEKENIDFHTRVRNGYEEFFANHTDPSRVFRVDANKTIEENHKMIAAQINNFFVSEDERTEYLTHALHNELVSRYQEKILPPARKQLF